MILDTKNMAKDLVPNRVTAIDLTTDEPLDGKHNTTTQPTYAVPDADKVNNTVQKETALAKAGVTRLKAFKVVAEALEAFEEVELRDGEGRAVKVKVPDVKRQQWGAEMAAKYFGDFVKEKQEIESGIRSLVATERDIIKRRITTILSKTVVMEEEI